MLAGFGAIAQDFADNALLFSRSFPGGSARIQGIGGAQVSLGGDYSSALSNPAGLGMYNRSELTFSPGLNFIKSSASYFNESSKDSKSVFNIPGFSLVFHTPSENETGFLGGSFAITLTRINDYNQDYQYSGVNTRNSMVDYFISDAGDIHPDEMLWPDNSDFPGSYYYSLTSLAYRNFLIEDQPEGNYLSPVNFNLESSRQREIIERRGAQYQWSLAYGANFSGKFFLGASLGINTIRFKLSQSYAESNFRYTTSDPPPIREFSLNEEYDIRGSGVNLTLGAIYRPVDFIQLGASFVTPTYYQITDSYTASMQSDWNNYDYYEDGTDFLNFVSDGFDQPLLYEYSLTTPMKFTTGVTFINKLGFITTDIEFVNYGKAKYRSDIAGEFDGDNRNIKSELNSVVNYRVGAEYRYNIFRFRAGYNHMSEPYVFDNGRKRSINMFTGGLGVKMQKYSIDFAATTSKTEGQRIPYFAPSGDPFANTEFSNLSFMLTVGFSF